MTIGTGKKSIRANATFQQALTATQRALVDAAAGVSLRSVTKKYGPVTAVENITLDIPAGYYCCLLCPKRTPLEPACTRTFLECVSDRVTHQ